MLSVSGYGTTQWNGCTTRGIKEAHKVDPRFWYSPFVHETLPLWMRCPLFKAVEGGITAPNSLDPGRDRNPEAFFCTDHIAGLRPRRPAPGNRKIAPASRVPSRFEKELKFKWKGGLDGKLQPRPAQIKLKAGCLETQPWVCPWSSETGSGPSGRVAAANVPSSETLKRKEWRLPAPHWRRSVNPRPFATLREP